MTAEILKPQAPDPFALNRAPFAARPDRTGVSFKHPHFVPGNAERHTPAGPGVAIAQPAQEIRTVILAPAPPKPIPPPEGTDARQVLAEALSRKSAADAAVSAARTALDRADREVAAAQAVLVEASKLAHIIFCDLDLDNGSYEGIQIIAALKCKYSDILFFLITSNHLTVGHLGNHIPNPDHILAKGYLGTPEYDTYLNGFIQRNLKRLPVAEVIPNFDLNTDGPRRKGGPPLSLVELHSMVEQCLVGANSELLGTDITKVELSLIPGGLSGSGVYRMDIWTGERQNKVPGILKISETAEARKEASNYNQYVKWRLPYTWRIDLLGSGWCGRFGAICYSFAMAGGSYPSAISTFMGDALPHEDHVLSRHPLQAWSAASAYRRRSRRRGRSSRLGRKNFRRFPPPSGRRRCR